MGLYLDVVSKVFFSFSPKKYNAFQDSIWYTVCVHKKRQLTGNPITNKMCYLHWNQIVMAKHMYIVSIPRLIYVWKLLFTFFYLHSNSNCLPPVMSPSPHTLRQPQKANYEMGTQLILMHIVRVHCDMSTVVMGFIILDNRFELSGPRLNTNTSFQVSSI